MKRKIIPSCSMCRNFDPNRGKCSIDNSFRDPISTESAVQCTVRGVFVRDLNVIPDAVNLFSDNDAVPGNFTQDTTMLSKDEEGLPLFVITKRGMERAVPATSSVKLKGDVLTGVQKVLTYQGQRELIYDLGVELARDIAMKAGVELMVLPEEENSKGNPREVRMYKQKQSRMKRHHTQWLADAPIESWN